MAVRKPERTPGVRPGQRTAIYVRISKDEAHDELGVRRQERECRQLCQRLGLQVVGVYTDDDRSAYSGKPRPGYQRMLEDLEADAFDVVAAWHPDRLHRSPVELEHFIDLVERCEAGVVTAQGGEYDLSTASGRMTARVVGAVARGESEHRSERLRSKMRELREAGKMTGGTGSRPYGYQEYVPGSHCPQVRPDEAEIIRHLVDRFLAGESLSSLARSLNAEQVPTVGGFQWRARGIRQLLLAPRLAGLRTGPGGELVPSPWPAIITPERHRMVAALLAERAEAFKQQCGRREPRRWLLSGVLRCGNCGRRMYGQPACSGVHARYRCLGKATGGCNSVSIRLEPTDKLVTERVWDLVDGPGFQRMLEALGGPPDDQGGEREAVERQLQELAEMWGAGDLTRSEWLSARSGLQKRLRAAGRREVQQAHHSVLERWRSRSLREAWPALSPSQRQSIISELLEITVMPADPHAQRRFDPGRVVVKRRL